MTVDHSDLKLAVFNELSAAMRHQSQAEYVYTASAVASYGGICLGVAALPSNAPIRVISIGVIVFVAILSLSIYRAISHNCSIYKRIQVSRVAVVQSLIQDGMDFIPQAWIDDPKPTGVNKAYAILGVSTFGAIAFAATRAFAA